MTGRLRLFFCRIREGSKLYLNTHAGPAITAGPVLMFKN